MTKLVNVFISYSSKDKKVAFALCDFLEAKNLSCWIAPRDIAVGADYAQSIVDGIQSALVMVLVFSQTSNGSQHIKNEVEMAIHHKIPVIPFRIHDTRSSSSLHFFLATTQWLDATKGRPADHFDELYRHCVPLLQPPGVSLPGKEKNIEPRQKKMRYAYLGLSFTAVLLFSIWLYGEYGSRNNAAIPDSIAKYTDSLKKEPADTAGKNKPVKEDDEKKKDTQVIINNSGTTKPQPVDKRIPGDAQMQIGGNFEDGASTDKMTLAFISPTVVSYSGRVAGYNVFGKMRCLNNKFFTVTEGNLSGSLELDHTKNNLRGNLLVKEINLSHPLNLSRKE